MVTTAEAATQQTIAWLQFDPWLTQRARRLLEGETVDFAECRDLKTWVGCVFGLCGLPHAIPDMPARVMLSLPDMRAVVTQEHLSQVNWDTVRSELQRPVAGHKNCHVAEDYDGERIRMHCDEHCPRVLKGDWDRCMGC
jgi:hypothetical protein